MRTISAKTAPYASNDPSKLQKLSLQNSFFVLKAPRAFLSFKTNLGTNSLRAAHFGQLSLLEIFVETLDPDLKELNLVVRF